MANLMRPASFIAVIVGTILVTTVAGTVFAKGQPTLNWGKETNAAACDAKGKPVINVTHLVENGLDSGFNGFWANNTYARNIQVWEIEEELYCAVVQYQGKFDAIAGAKSPGQSGGSSLGGDERGTFQGGYRAYISGFPASDVQRNGFIGKKDYGCESMAGTNRSQCDNLYNWVDEYFEESWGFDYKWWGWIYRGGAYGTWINAQSGSSGDIQ